MGIRSFKDLDMKLTMYITGQDVPSESEVISLKVDHYRRVALPAYSEQNRRN